MFYLRLDGYSRLRYLLTRLHGIAQGKAVKRGSDSRCNADAVIAEESGCGNAKAPAPEEFPAQQAGALPAIGADVEQRLSSPVALVDHDEAYFTTMLISLLGTTTTLTTCLPTMAACTLGSASAACCMASLPASGKRRTTARNLPFTCTGISSSSSLARSGLKVGQGWRSSAPVPPICPHSSAVR